MAIHYRGRERVGWIGILVLEVLVQEDEFGVTRNPKKREGFVTVSVNVGRV